MNLFIKKIKKIKGTSLIEESYGEKVIIKIYE